MTHIKIRNKPKLKLVDVLRRRKQTLIDYLQSAGIQSYSALCGHCLDLGVQEPSEDDYNKLGLNVVTDQSEGIIVIEPLEHAFEEKEDEYIPSQRKSRKKRQQNTEEQD